MSENGPREGTRDLPRPSPDAGRRAVEEDSPAGMAYGSLSRLLRRRRAFLVALLEEGEPASTLAATYRRGHPLEPEVSDAEREAAIAEAKARALRADSRIGQGHGSRTSEAPPGTTGGRRL